MISNDKNKSLAVVLGLFFCLLTACNTAPIKPMGTSLLDIPEQPVEETIAVCEALPPKTIIQYVPKKCPVIKPVKSYNDKLHEKLVVGRVENIAIDGSILVLKARVDTGATTSSLNALNLTYFERDGKKWVRFLVWDSRIENKTQFERKIKRHVRIKELVTENQRRPVVLMTLRVGDVEESVEVTLTDRSKLNYPVLLGRNFLLDRMVVDVSQKFITKIQ